MLSRCYRTVTESFTALIFRRAIAHVSFVLLALLMAVPIALGATANPEQGVVVSNHTSVIPEYDFPVDPVLVVTPHEPRFTLQTAFHAQVPRLPRRLLNTGDQQISWQVVAVASQIDIEVVNEGAILATFPDPRTRMSALTDWYHRFRINYMRPWDQSRYGVEYRYVGDHYTPANNSKLTPDQALVDLWGRWQFGPMQLHTSVNQVWDNVDLEPNRSRLTTTRGKMQMEIVLPALPSLTLSYTRGSAWRSRKPTGAASRKSWLDTFEATLHYTRPTWQATLASIYSASQDQLRQDHTAVYLYHELNLIYRPTAKLSVAPAVRMTQHRSATSKVWTDTPNVGLSLYYQRLFDVVDLTADGSYTHSYSRDGSWDTHTIDGVVSLKWHFKKFRFGPAAMVFEVSYMDYTDAKIPTNSFAAFTGGWSVEMTF